MSVDSNSLLSHSARWARIIALHQQGRLAEAATALESFIMTYPLAGQAHFLLGAIAHDQGRYDQAVGHLCRALELAPKQAAIFCLLGSTYHYLRQFGDAARAYQHAIALSPAQHKAYNNLGLVLLDDGQVEEAVKILDAVLLRNPDYAAARENRTHALLALARQRADANQTEAAKAVYDALLACQPDHLSAMLGAALTLPRVASSKEALVTARTGYAAGLDRLVDAARIFLNVPAPTLLSRLAWVNFYLAYQGGNDKALQMQYGQFLHRVLASCVPHLMQKRAERTLRTPQRGRRLRIGFVSALFRRGTVSGYFSSWVTGLDAARFERFVYYAGVCQDVAIDSLAASCDGFRHIAATDGAQMLALAETIANDELDILIYPDLGMTAELFPVAAMRLAPVQCVAWGHPSTTGLPNIDYYFSVASMEPEDGPSHYSEQLLLLPGIGTCFQPSRPTTMQPGVAFNLPASRHWYLFPHAPFKIHPDNDTVLTDIAAADPLATFILVQDRQQTVMRDYVSRAKKAFLARGLPSDGRFVVLPSLSHDDYLHLNRTCHVMLDCLHWSGGATTLDAIASSLPVLTCPGATMRSRQSAAMLESIGMRSLIASDPSQLAAKAVGIACDANARQVASDHLAKYGGMLFRQTDALRALELCLHRLATGALVLQL